jgi:hypothetical protein
MLIRNINYTAQLKLHILSETIQNSRFNNSLTQTHYIATEESTHYLFVKELLQMIHHDEITSTQYTSLTTARKY